jgi:hypothetical protein
VNASKQHKLNGIDEVEVQRQGESNRELLSLLLLGTTEWITAGATDISDNRRI